MAGQYLRKTHDLTFSFGYYVLSQNHANIPQISLAGNRCKTDGTPIAASETSKHI